MNLLELQRPEVISPFTDDFSALPQPRRADGVDTEDFQNAFSYALEQVDQAQTDAGHQVEAFIAGEQENLHEVMISLNQAKLSFHLLTEVRNKMMDTYQELIRMQM